MNLVRLYRSLGNGDAKVSFLICTFILLLLAVAISRFLYPFDLGNFESVIQAPAALAIAGKNPYNFALTEPYVMAPYGYFYYLLVGLCNTLWFGRLLSILAGASIVYSIYKLSSNPLLSITFFLASSPFLSMWAVQRPDLLALACGSMGFVLLRRHILLASLLCFSALFFKQTFVLMPFFAGVYLLWKRRWRDAALFYAVGVSMSLLIIALLGKGYVWQHFVLTRNIPASYAQAGNICLAFLLNPAMVGLLFLSRSKYAVYAAAACVLAFITSARIGANVNYYLETVFVLSLMLRRTPNLIPLTILLVCGSLQLVRNIRGEYLRWQGVEYYREIQRQYLNYSNGVGISVYCDLIPTYHFGDWIQYVDGRSPELQKTFIDALRSGRYKAIIWYNPNDPLLLNYDLVPINQPLPPRPVYLYVLKKR